MKLGLRSNIEQKLCNFVETGKTERDQNIRVLFMLLAMELISDCSNTLEVFRASSEGIVLYSVRVPRDYGGDQQ